MDGISEEIVYHWEKVASYLKADAAALCGCGIQSFCVTTSCDNRQEELLLVHGSCVFVYHELQGGI
jgi:hypothetical protein